MQFCLILLTREFFNYPSKTVIGYFSKIQFRFFPILHRQLNSFPLNSLLGGNFFESWNILQFSCSALNPFFSPKCEKKSLLKEYFFRTASICSIYVFFSSSNLCRIPVFPRFLHLNNSPLLSPPQLTHSHLPYGQWRGGEKKKLLFLNSSSSSSFLPPPYSLPTRHFRGKKSWLK